MHRLLLLLLLGALSRRLDAYNLEASRAQLFTDPGAGRSERSSYFGFSVALYTGRDESLLLVGAPRANSSRSADRRDGVVEPGAVYRCRLGTRDGDSRCVEWLVDSVPDNRIFGRNSPVRQKKDHAWLGATLRVENSTTPRVLVCAPMWKKNLRTYLGENWYMNGMCYSTRANSSAAFTGGSAARHFPLVEHDEQVVAVGESNYFYYGMGQAGFAADIGTELVVGAPGLFHWTGSVLQLREDDTFEALLPKVIGDSRFEYNDYFGYSITSGCFYKQGERLFASGAPRSGNTQGKVIIFAFPEKKGGELIIKNVIEGEQYGEYFGSTLTSCDINNDGRDDLIIGAPLWSKDTDEGRVYAYISEGQSDFKVQRLDGAHPQGRFGSSLACLGDLDQDGVNDLAVGAPYESDQRGAVYVFNGALEGLRPSQRLAAAELAQLAGVRGFGAALAEPARDVDGNGYVDLAVGAYLSGHAVLLPSKSVARVRVVLTQLDKRMLFENSTHFDVKVCAEYDGVFVPDTFKVTIILKIDDYHKRALVYQNGRLYGNIFKFLEILKKEQQTCTPVKIYLKKKIQNFIDPIEVTANIRNSEDPSCSKCPVINPTLSQIADTLKLAYALDCGTENVCISDLRVNVTSSLSSDGQVSRYVVGSKSNVNLTVYVENTEEPAYRAQVHVYVPEPIALVRLPLECDEQPQVNGTTDVVCNLGNPLRHNNSVVIELDMSAIQYIDKFVDIRINVTTQSKDKNPLNNNASLRINYDIDADLAIVGQSEEKYYSYLESEVNETNSKTFTFHHMYELQKFGLTPIGKASLYVNIPTTLNGMKLSKLNQIRGSISGRRYVCESTPAAIERRFAIRENQANDSAADGFEERTLYVNCSSPGVACLGLRCEVGPFVESQAVARLILTFELSISNFTVETAKNKDVMLFVSEGFVEIIQPNVSTGYTNKKPNFKQISTAFFYRRNPDGISIWIVIFSVLLGLVFLVIISLLLFKLGFFERMHKEDMQTSKLTEEVHEESVSESVEDIETTT